MNGVKWKRVDDEWPAGNVGDRIVLIVSEREAPENRKVPRLVILEAVDDGWTSPDPMYAGYDPEDGIVWTWERSIIGTAEDVR